MQFDEGEQTSGAPIKDKPGAVAILHIGGMDDNVQEKAERVDKDMSLAARDLLARIKALRVERCARLGALAVDDRGGRFASRPSCSRVTT